MRHRLDTRMVGDPRDWYAQRDGAAVHHTKWAQQVVLYAAAMMPALAGIEGLEGRFDGVAVHFGAWAERDGIHCFHQVASYVLPDRQLPPPAPVAALPAPKVI